MFERRYDVLLSLLFENIYIIAEKDAVFYYSMALNFAFTCIRRVPIPLQTAVTAEHDEMQRTGVISKVTEPSDWCAAMVPAP